MPKYTYAMFLGVVKSVEKQSDFSAISKGDRKYVEENAYIKWAVHFASIHMYIIRSQNYPCNVLTAIAYCSYCRMLAIHK